MFFMACYSPSQLRKKVAEYQQKRFSRGCEGMARTIYETHIGM
jgi:hypothetical protein